MIKLIDICIFVVCCLVVSRVDAQQEVGDLVVVATVNGEHIHLSEVERELRTAFGTREIADSARPFFQAKALEQLIDRRLIIQWLRTTGRAAAPEEIELEISRLEKQLESREISLAKHLKSIGVTEAEMRRLLDWQISWRKFLARYLTDENLEKYFNDHRREFDGTRMRVAHILFKLDDLSSVEDTIQRADKIRESIAKGEISFEDAAIRHSVAPTADEGGDIGFIERHRPMHEAFSQAAFVLDEQQVSPPVVTPFGVHLIRCIEIEPGQRTWQDAREALTTAVTRYLFDWAAAKERPNAEMEIQFTDGFPHFVPGTQQLAE